MIPGSKDGRADSVMRDILGIRHFVRATGNSLCGLWEAFRNGCAFRQEMAFSLTQFAALCFIRESVWVKTGLVSLWVILLALELVNSAVEAVVDLVSPEWNVLAKRAKDQCSAAVFLIVVLIASVWLIVGVRQFCRLAGD